MYILYICMCVKKLIHTYVLPCEILFALYFFSYYFFVLYDLFVWFVHWRDKLIRLFSLYFIGAHHPIIIHTETSMISIRVYIVYTFLLPKILMIFDLCLSYIISCMLVGRLPTQRITRCLLTQWKHWMNWKICNRKKKKYCVES